MSELTARFLRRLATRRSRIPGLYRPPRSDEDEVFLTFDDGPFPDTTPYVLDALATQGAKATFFVVGRNVVDNPGLAERIVAEGHVLANHTFSHPRLTAMGTAEALADIARCQEVIGPLGGVPIFRPTYGLMGLRLYMRLARHGYRVAYWTVDSARHQDNRGNGAGALLERDLAGEVLLLHDDNPHDIATLKRLLAATSARGQRFGLLR